MSYFQSPRYFGIEDHTVAGSNPFQLRVYYPTDDDVIVGAPLPPGPHPLVVFAHGDRTDTQFDGLCPRDLTRDHCRWTVVLGAIARSGFVVAAPEMVFSGGAARVSAAIEWMRTQWSGRRTLHIPPVFDPGASRASHSSVNPNDANVRTGASGTPTTVARVHIPTAILGAPTALGLVGHSWGARACAELLPGGGVQAIAAIAGTFDDNASIAALGSAQVPNFLLCGTTDSTSFSYVNGLWPSLATPKYQAAFKEVDHFDWFGRDGAIRHCDGTPPDRPDSGHIAGELLTGFLTRHVARVQFDPPHLIRIPLLRPWHIGWYDHGSAIQMRWDAPGEHFGSLPSSGDGILGPWAAGTAPW
jgi:dienelactone hydrolase